MSTDTACLADLLGPSVETDWKTGLMERCRNAWSKPLRELSREELATLLRQRIAVEYLMPVARKRLEDADDDTELYEGELKEAIAYATQSGE
jgi:hypothetical protein